MLLNDANLKWHSKARLYTMTPSIGKTFNQTITLSSNLIYYRINRDFDRVLATDLLC